jgi:hypothetical protein
MSAIIPEEFNRARSFLFENTVFNNPFRLRRSQILVARIPPPRAQRAVVAQCILDLILRETISHLRREILLNLIVLPISRTYGAHGRMSLSYMLTSLV